MDYLSRAFLEFFPKPVYSTMVVEEFQVYGVKITGKYIYSYTQAKISPRFLSLPSSQKETTHSSRAAFSEDLFFPSRKGKGGEDYGVKEITKIKPTRVLVASFNKFHHLSTICFVVP